jgi:hypothetical protein
MGERWQFIRDEMTWAERGWGAVGVLIGCLCILGVLAAILFGIWQAIEIVDLIG